VLDVAVDSGPLAANPASRVRLPRPQRFEAHFLTRDELELLASRSRRGTGRWCSSWRGAPLSCMATLRAGATTDCGIMA
jgi:integrase